MHLVNFLRLFYVAKSKISHSEHGESNSSPGHNQHRALDDAWCLAGGAGISAVSLTAVEEEKSSLLFC
jgi:hypothetical protein